MDDEPTASGDSLSQAVSAAPPASRGHSLQDSSRTEGSVTNTVSNSWLEEDGWYGEWTDSIGRQNRNGEDLLDYMHKNRRLDGQRQGLDGKIW